MQWWDTSAILAMVLVEEPAPQLETLFADDDELAVWWGTKVEGVSGIYRTQRDGSIRPHTVAGLLSELDRMLSLASVIPPSEEVRSLACRMLRLHSLHAGDALQLAAALVWTEHRPAGMGFVCVDRRLCEAAAREGFRILPETE